MFDVPQVPAVPMSGMSNGTALPILAGEAGPAAAVARVLAAWMRRLGDGSPRRRRAMAGSSDLPGVH